MPFHEIHGRYFAAVGKILCRALDGSLTPRQIEEIVRETAFGESMLTIPENLRNEAWPLLTADMRTPIRHAPSMPLTTLQKRWMKALLSDPRIRLFGVNGEGLEDVAPLWKEDTFVYFDQYRDGDPYEDPDYIRRFGVILTALKESRRLRIEFTSGRGQQRLWNCIPRRLEYSQKDDKFRLITASAPWRTSINLSRITACALAEPFLPEEVQQAQFEKQRLVLELRDERNALERVMMHFSHLEKETERLAEDLYRLTLLYEAEDETELLIRVLSFGPMLKVLEPRHFVEQMKNRIQKQLSLRTQQ